MWEFAVEQRQQANVRIETASEDGLGAASGRHKNPRRTEFIISAWWAGGHPGIENMGIRRDQVGQLQQTVSISAVTNRQGGISGKSWQIKMVWAL